MEHCSWGTVLLFKVHSRLLRSLCCSFTALFVHSFFRSFTASFVHSFIFVRSLVRTPCVPSFIHCSIRSLALILRSVTCLFSLHSFVQSSIRLLVRSFSSPLILPFVRLLFRSFTRSVFVHCSVRSFTLPLIRSLVFYSPLTRLLDHSFFRSFVPSLSFTLSFMRSLIRCFFRSIIRPFSHSFVRTLLHSCAVRSLICSFVLTLCVRVWCVFHTRKRTRSKLRIICVHVPVTA